jgi:hypothetical protein
VTFKRNPSSPRSALGETTSPATLRSGSVAEPAALLDENEAAPVYYEPQPLIAVSDHKTIEVETVKLAVDIDPRKLPTELRLVRPPSVPPDSGWPQTDVVVVSSQPPLAARRRWRASALLFVPLVPLGALLMVALARGAVQRSHAASPAPSVEMQSRQPPRTAPASEAAEPVPATAITAPNPIPTIAASDLPQDVAPPASALVPLAPARSAKIHASAPHIAAKPISHAKTSPTLGASSPVLAQPSPPKPKRAIY